MGKRAEGVALLLPPLVPRCKGEPPAAKRAAGQQGLARSALGAAPVLAARARAAGRQRPRPPLLLPFPPHSSFPLPLQAGGPSLGAAAAEHCAAAAGSAACALALVPALFAAVLLLGLARARNVPAARARRVGKRGGRAGECFRVAAAAAVPLLPPRARTHLCLIMCAIFFCMVMTRRRIKYSTRMGQYTSTLKTLKKVMAKATAVPSMDSFQNLNSPTRGVKEGLESSLVWRGSVGPSESGSTCGCGVWCGGGEGVRVGRRARR